MCGHIASKRQDEVLNLGFFAFKSQVLHPYTLMIPRKPALGVFYFTAVQPQASPFASVGQPPGGCRLAAFQGPACGRCLSESQPRLPRWDYSDSASENFPASYLPVGWFLHIIRKPTGTLSPILFFLRLSLLCQVASGLEQRKRQGVHSRKAGVCRLWEEEGRLEPICVGG